MKIIVNTGATCVQCIGGELFSALEGGCLVLWRGLFSALEDIISALGFV